jgi:hypothetical protein
MAHLHQMDPERIFSAQAEARAEQNNPRYRQEFFLLAEAPALEEYSSRLSLMKVLHFIMLQGPSST